MSDAAETRKGVMFGASAYLLWGLFPLYWPLLEPAGAVEILAHRMVWSVLFVAVVLTVTGGWRTVRSIVGQPRVLRLLGLAAVLVSVNWGMFIWAVNSGHVVEASLGYFINPLLTILLGVVVLKESLTPPQWLAVGVASLAIVVLTIDLGRLPWIALTVAVSFAGYGFIKKRVGVGAVDSLAVETGLLAIPALVTLLVLQSQSDLVFAHHGAGNALLLAGTGVVTAVPLLLFGAGARRLPLSSIGLLQYLAPVLQFAVGIRHEPLPLARLLGFALVWLALVILTVQALRGRTRVGADSAAAGRSPSARQNDHQPGRRHQPEQDERERTDSERRADEFDRIGQDFDRRASVRQRDDLAGLGGRHRRRG